MAAEITVKSVLNKTKRRDPWFLDDYTLNLYSSCAFNCLYCYIRGSKYGQNLEDSLSVKMNAIEILDRQLANRAKKNQYGYIMLSSATDPYLGIEKKYSLTRSALEMILKHRFPVHIITKSPLVERDFDLLHAIDRTAILPNDLKVSPGRGTIISFSFSGIDDAVARIFEPGAPRPSERLETLGRAVSEGFLAGVSLMPLLPHISDTGENLHLLFRTFQARKACYIFPATLTLFGEAPGDSKTLVLGAIRKHFPHLEEKYLRFFSQGSQMPPQYRSAFDRKIRELSQKYCLPLWIT
jgi:DNA repair photolyase